MTSTVSIRQNKKLLAAALAAISTMTLVLPASAQFAANQDGHAQDASNRVGSGGYNQQRSGGGGYTANDVAERNVSGGRAFHGPIGERDPRAFTGPLSTGLVDQFNRQGNVPQNSTGPINANFGQAQTFYSENRLTAPPAGSIPLGFQGGYVGTELNSPLSLSSAFNTSRMAQSLDARTMDEETLRVNRTLNSPNYVTLLNNPTFNQSGTLDMSTAAGMQTLQLGIGNPSLPELPDRAAGPEDSALMHMRDELRQSSLNPNVVAPTKGETTPNEAQKPTGLNQPLNQPIGQAFDAPVTGAIPARAISSQLPTAALESTGTIPSANAARTSMLPSAMEQSSLLATLQNRLEQSGEVGRTLVGNRPVQPANARQGGRPTVTPPNPEQGPVPVSSLATGIKAKGLHDLLSGAEDLIKDGKYDSSIQQYNQAVRVAPNNPLPVLGRAHAELAGGYYARAEMDLRAVFRNDPELLLAQFDLGTLFSKDRIDYVRKDLHNLAETDAKSERPWFLLAYLDYNTGDAATADKDLNEAEQRSGRADWAVRLLRQHWALPSNPKPAPITPRPGSALPMPAGGAANSPPAQSTTPSPAPAPEPQLNK